LKGATQSFGTPASAAIDGNQQTGWSINGGQGRAHHAVFPLAAPLAGAKEVKGKLLFERYYAARLGRFRPWLTNDTKAAPARDFPLELEPALLLDATKRSGTQTQQLKQQFLRTAPELAKARAKIDALRKQLPRHPTTLVMAERPKENPR